MEALETPLRIVETDGRVHEGWFRDAVERVNLLDAPVAHKLSAFRGTSLAPIERAYRRMRLKEWQYVSVVTDQTLFACAVVNAGYIGTAFAYVVDRTSGVAHEWNTLVPLARGVRIAENSIDGRTSIERRGFGRIELDNDRSRGERRVFVELAPTRTAPALFANFHIVDTGRDPDAVAVVERVAPSRWLYTHKCYGLATEGTLECGLIREVSVPGGNALAGIDWNRGYRLPETYWNWAAGTGRAKSGARVGFNLTAHRPPPGMNLHGADHTHGHEADAADCALWLGSECIRLARVEFEYDPERLMDRWKISDKTGAVDLEFQPLGERREKINLGLIVSDFHQPYGTFRGTLRAPSGTRYEVENVFGVTEQHFARW